MRTLPAREHGLRHAIFRLSTSFRRGNHASTPRRPLPTTWTSNSSLEDHNLGLTPTPAAVQRLYTPIAHPIVPNSQDQNNGTPLPLETTSTEQWELRILERAQGLGITTMTELLRESTFENHLLNSTRLINRKPFSNNLELWCLLLDFQRVRFGKPGVKRMWYIMKDRVGRVDEFFQGPISDYLWSILISTGQKDHGFLRKLCKHEIELGAKRSSLYVDVVGSLLASNSHTAARLFSQVLQPTHPVTSDNAYELFMQACNSSNEHAFDDFIDICKTFEQIQIYSRVIPYLCNEKRFGDAWKMHKFLLSRGDLPLEFESVKPLIRYTASTKDRFEEFLQDLKEQNVAYEAQARQVHENEKGLQYGIAGGSLNIVSSRTMGVQPSRLSDKFVARAFATKAFSFDFALQGLRLLGLREIGPLALRQIALKACSPAQLCRRLDMLKELDIDWGSSTYARIVTSLAKQGKATLLSDVLMSDQHPDVFEDLDLQEKLLAQYYRESDWRQVNRTLAILRVGHQEFSYDERVPAKEVPLNALLRSVIRVRDWPGVTRIMAQIKHQGCHLTIRTLRCMHNTILSKRASGQKPKLSKSFDDVGFVLNVFRSAKNAGTHIPPTFWREPIRRLGMLRRWNDLERMLFRLAATYSRRAGLSAEHPSAFQRIIAYGEKDIVSRIFSVPLQRAVVEWAFLYPKPRRRLFRAPLELDMEERHSEGTYVPFTRGVRVLRMLQDQYGVPIDMMAVRMACLQSLRKRFAPDYFAGHPAKYNLHRKYDVSLLPDSLDQLNTAWSGSLFHSKSK